jgi:hypothetical protein
MPLILPDTLPLPVQATDEIIVHRGQTSYVTPATAGTAIAPSSISQFVALDTPVTLGTIRLEARLTGGQGFRIGAVAGTINADISALCTFATDSVFGSNRPNVALTAAMLHPFAWLGQSDADHITGMVRDRTNSQVYEFKIITCLAPTLSFIQIVRIL